MGTVGRKGTEGLDWGRCSTPGVQWTHSCLPKEHSKEFPDREWMISGIVKNRQDLCGFKVLVGKGT